MSIKLISAEQLSALAETVKGKINVLDTAPATVNGSLWIDGGGSVPVIKLLYNGNIYQTSTELVPAPVTPVNPVTPAEQFTFTVLDLNTEETDNIFASLQEADLEGDISGFSTEELQQTLQAFGTQLVLIECRSVLFSGTIPDEPPEIILSPNNPPLEGVVLLVFLADEGTTNSCVVEAHCGEDGNITVTISLDVVAQFIDIPTTMVVLQPQEE